MPMLNPVGYVGQSEYDLLKFTTIIMALIVVPVILLTFWVAFRYRASVKHDDFDPEFDDNKVITGVTIFVPLVTICVLGALNWIYTHRLDPYQPLGADEKPYEIQAVSLDYKWLFIYPEEGVAVVNQLVAPAHRPVTIRITSDPMMTSIFIPGLVSQIYAMPGMETRANFLADRVVTMEGANAMYSGPGFTKQRFLTHILEPEDFAAWAAGAAEGKALTGTIDAQVEPVLDFARYEKLAERTEGYPIAYFQSVGPDLFQDVIRRYMPHYVLSALPTANEYAREN